MSQALASPAPPVATTADDALRFTSLYHDCFPRVYAYLATLLRDRALAEEVTADAFERAFRKRRSYRASRGSPEAWLFGIARNAALDELRRRRREVALEDAWAEPTSADEIDAALSRAVVRSALARLAPRERDLLALKFAGGLSHAEIGRVLGISESNAGTTLHRTIEKLREACHEQPS